MTPLRLGVLAFAALLATGGALLLSSQRQLPRETRAGDPVMPQLRAALGDVAELRVSRGDGAQVTLRRATTGWSVVERGWAADSGKVRKLLLDLAALAVVEEKTHDPGRYAVLGVEDVSSPAAAGTRIDLRTAQGAIHSLIVGKSAGARAGFVRAAGASASYLASPQLVATADAASWLDRALLDVEGAQLRAVTLEHASRAPRSWQAPAVPQALAGALRGLALEDVRTLALDAAPAAATHRARFVTWDGLVIEIGGHEDGPRRWITVGARLDPAALRPRPPGIPAPVVNAAALAATLAARGVGREFEVPAFRFDALFEAPAG